LSSTGAADPPDASVLLDAVSLALRRIGRMLLGDRELANAVGDDDLRHGDGEAPVMRHGLDRGRMQGSELLLSLKVLQISRTYQLSHFLGWKLLPKVVILALEQPCVRVAQRLGSGAICDLLAGRVRLVDVA
jgi:hypothetical protein